MTQNRRKNRLALIALGVIMLLAACAGGGEAESGLADLADDDVVTVFSGDLAASATASGQIEAGQRASLSVSGSSLVSDVLVRVGDEVTAGDVLMTLDTTELELNLTNAQQALRAKEASLAALLDSPSEYEIAAAEADLASAQASYDDLLDGPSAEEIEISEAGVAQANATIYSANASLNNTLSTVTEADVEAARAELVAAEAQLEQAQETNERFANDRTHNALITAENSYAEAAAKFARVSAGADANSVNQSQAEVAAAVSRRDRSQAELDELLLDPTDSELANVIYNVAQAQYNLDELLEGASDAQIAIAEAEVAQAQLDVADAEAALADAQIIAPFDGLITAVNFTVGEYASGIAIELADMNSLEVVLSVDESDLSVISTGQQANITLETWPSTNIPSEVASIAPSAAEDGSGIIAYDVHVALGETDLPIKIGMTADANLITEERADVLLVPNVAITADRQSGQFFVNLIEGETISEVEITIGLRDNNNTQVLSGVNEGDNLVIDYQVPIREGGPPGGGR